MYFIQAGGFNWKDIFLGESEWEFIPEVLLRSAIMFMIVLAALRILGKRGVRQLSVFELVVIITLGSAAGDPMFYKEVGIIPALGVFVVIVSFYYLITYAVGKSERFERLIEGKPVCLIEAGEFSIDNFKKEALAQDEFFAELRVKGISHLGQVKQAIIETSGDISVFFYEDELVKPGLPILPGLFSAQHKSIPSAGIYSCTFCGHTESIAVATPSKVCGKCSKEIWVRSDSGKRVT